LSASWRIASARRISDPLFVRGGRGGAIPRVFPPPYEGGGQEGVNFNPSEICLKANLRLPFVRGGKIKYLFIGEEEKSRGRRDPSPLTRACLERGERKNPRLAKTEGFKFTMRWL